MHGIKIFGLAVVLFLCLMLAILVGDYAPWYFAWLVGTTMIVLIAAAGAVLFETQEEARASGNTKQL